MRNTTLVFVPLLCIVSSFAVLGSEELNLRGLIEAALRNDPDRRETVERLAAVGYDAAYEKSRRSPNGSIAFDAVHSEDPYPLLTYADSAKAALNVSAPIPGEGSLKVGLSYDAKDLRPSKSDPDPEDRVALSAELGVPVLVNGRIVDLRLGPAAVRSAAERPLAAARNSLEESGRAIAADTFALALNYAAAERSFSLAERRAALAEREALVARTRVELGTLSRRELAEAEEASDSSALALIDARHGRDAALGALARRTGVPPGDIDPKRLRAPDAAPMRSGSPAAAIAGGSVRKAILDREAAEDALLLSALRGAAQISVFGNLSTPGPLLRSDNAGSDPDWSVGLRLNIPIAPGVNEAYRKSAERKLAAASQAERGARSLAADAAAKAYSDVEAAEARQEYFAKRVDLTRTRLQETLAALENETATELDAERARIAADAAGADFENARSARCIALLKLKSLSAPTVEDLLSELMDE